LIKNREIELERLNNIVKFHSPTHTHECCICGCWFEEFPWGEDGKSSSYELCPCFGIQFGKEDITPEYIQQFMDVWKKQGYRWYDKTLKSDSWDLNEQMKKIPNGCHEFL
jgi:hypothetical protein